MQKVSPFRSKDDSLLTHLLGAPRQVGGGSADRIRIYRIILAIGAALILAFGVLYQQLSGAAVDPIGIRAGMAAMALALIGASYRSGWARCQLGRLYRGYIYLTVLWVAGLLVVNQFAWTYGLGVVFLHAAAGLAFGVGLRRPRPLGWFLAVSTVLPLVGAGIVADPITPPLVLGLSLAGLSVLIYLAINHRIQAERQLRESRQRADRLRREFATIFEAVPDATFLVDVRREEGDLRFAFLRLNAAHEDLTGMETDRIRGRTPREVLGEETGAEVEARYRRCVEAGEPIEYEEELPTPAGTKRWHTKLAPVLEDGEVALIVGIARDITDRTRREEQLRLLDRVIQHDLRGDVNSAHGWARVLQEKTGNSRASRFIQQATAHMMEILEAAHTLQEALRSGREMELRPVPVIDHLEQAIQTAERRYPDATIADHVPRDFQSCVVANELLGSVFENLITNGIRHNDQTDPRVEVRLENGPETVAVTIADNGSGIPPEARSALFEQGSRGIDSPGMGLGLYLVRTLTDLYGGEIGVSENEPRGSRFTVTLKRAEAAPGPGS